MLEQGEPYLAREPILLDAAKIQQVIEMQASELGFSQRLVVEFSPAFHDCTEHLIVASSSKEYLAGVQFKQCATYRPNINSKVVRHAEDYGNKSAFVFDGVLA